MPKRRSQNFVLAVSIPLLALLLTACGAGANATGPTITTGSAIIKIATELPVSGKDTASGKPAENGAHLAVDQANQSNLLPGYTFVFVSRDDVGPQGMHDMAVGQKNIMSLEGDALVAGVVGPLNTNVAQAEMPVANRVPLALISPSNTADCLTQTTPEAMCGGANNKLSTYRPTNKVTYFRIATLDQYQGGALAKFGVEKGYKKVYILDDAEIYGVAIANTFKGQWMKLGGTVVGHKSVPSTTTSYVTILTEIAATNPDVIFFGGNDSTGGTLIRQQMLQMVSLKNMPLIGGDGMQTSSFAQTIGHDGGPVFTSQALIDASKLDSARDFIAKYNAVYGASNISSSSAGSYDCAMIIMQAVKIAIQNGTQTPKDSNDAAQARIFRQAVINAIQQIDYNGITGHQSFDKNGDTTNRAISIKTIGDDVNQGDGWMVVDILKAEA